MNHRKASGSAKGLVFIPRHMADVAPLVQDLHTLGIPSHAVSVVGRVDETASKILAEHADPPPRSAQQALGPTLTLIEPSVRFAALGMSLGGLAGVLGGFVALALPGMGTLWFAGGVELLLEEEAVAGLAGMDLGAIVGLWLGRRVRQEHAERFRHALNEGKVLVVAQGTPEAIARVQSWLRTYELDHLDVF